MKKGTSILNNYTDELKELYLNSDLPLEKIGEIYNVSRETVTNFAKRQGWYGLRQDAPRATYQLNQEYFDVIDSEDKAYWLGFIAADGNIRKDFLRLSIELARCDKNHLVKFRDSLNSNAPIKDMDRENPSSYIRINNKHLCLALANYGIVPNKSLTFTVKLDLIPQIYLKDFIRGYFDGDGSIYQDRRGSWGINFTGSHSFMAQLKELLPFEIYTNDRGNYSSLETQSKTKIKIFLDFIYSNATIYLDRKYLKSQEFYKPSTTTKG